MEKQYDLTNEENNLLPPYPMEEIDARIAQAESELEAGLGIPSDVVFARARAYVMSKL